MRQGTGTGTRLARRWWGRGQKWRIASRAVGDERLDVETMVPQRTGWAPDQRQQRPQRWVTRSPADAGNAAHKQGEDQSGRPVCVRDTRG